MEAQAMVLVLRFFGELIDPRGVNVRHRFIDILAIAIMATIAASDDIEGIVEYGLDHESWLKTFLKLPHGIPSASTFRRVLARLNPAAMEKCFIGWMAELVNSCRDKQIAVDGKALRRSFQKAWEKMGLHLVSAWCVEENLVLGQVATDQKSNEITAVPKLLEMIDIQGAVVTADALNCQKDIAHQIITSHADYLLSVKDNHPTLHQQIQSLMDEAHLEKFKDVQHDTHRQVNAEHGRKEVRTTYCSEELTQWVGQRAEWMGLRTLVKVQRVRQVVGQPATMENHYFITSLPGTDAQRISQLVRRHWGIENGQHWCLDMGFREDESRVGCDHGAENLAVLRRIALNLLKSDKTCRLGIKNKRLKAARSPRYLLSVMSQQSVAK